MSSSTFDDEKYEHLTYDQEKFVNKGHSGKNRSKKEAEQHTNRHNPGGHERKLVYKLKNTEINKRNK